VGIKGMSSAIKHMGSGVANAIMTTTANPLVALFIGILTTTLVQSSSTTTSMIVSMVSSGALPLSSAVPMIMGANIGTTVTNTIVSIGHINRGNEFKRAFAASTVHDFFNVFAVIILFPLEYYFHLLERTARAMGTFIFGHVSAQEVFHSPIKTAVKWGTQQIQMISFDHNILYLILSILLTFLMLYSIVKLLRKLVLAKVEVFFDQYIFKTVIRGFIFGIVLTFLVQSSSITTSLIIPLAGAGVLTLRQIYPYTLGANIGTTATALIAAMTLNVTALVAGFAHLLFNIFGIFLVNIFPFTRKLPIFMAEKLSEYSIRNKFIPLIYLGIIFFALPLTVILIGG